MAGLFLVSDAEEAGLGLSMGAQDLPLVIQDRNFDASNQFEYLVGRGGEGGSMGWMMGRRIGGGMGSMMAGMKGVLGRQILVNGRLESSLEVGRRAHRLRLLNGSNIRTLKLAWSDGRPLSVIGTDGGLLAAPVQRHYVMLAPADRIEL